MGTVLRSQESLEDEPVNEGKASAKTAACSKYRESSSNTA